MTDDLADPGDWQAWHQMPEFRLRELTTFLFAVAKMPMEMTDP
jgi:hypothetical protein